MSNLKPKSYNISTIPETSKDVLRLEESNASSISKIQSVKYIIKLLLTNPRLFKAVINLKYLCNNNDLDSGTGIYTNYPFNGKIFTGSKLTSIEDAMNGSIISFKSITPEECSKIFTNKFSLDYLLNNGLETSQNEKVKELLHDVCNSLISNVIVTAESVRNLNEGIRFARESKKKLVILSTHSSHLDAPVLDYILQSKLSLNGLLPRFVCGAYMYYNRDLRTFVPGFNTIFVYGPKDFQNLTSHILKEHKLSKRRDLKGEFHSNGSSFKAALLRLKDIKSLVNTTIKSKASSEVAVLFPYAGRAKKGEDINYELGCKESIPNGLEELLVSEDCIFLPLAMNGVDNIFPTSKSGGGNLVKNLSDSEASRLRVSIGIPFIGGEKTLSDIHFTMLKTSIKAKNEL